MFDLKNVSYSYDGKVNALADVTLQIPRGESVAIVGANGSGKTTLLRLLNGLIFPTSGVYRFDGERITRKALAKTQFAKTFHRRVGFVFQNADAQLFCGSVEDEIAFGPRQLNLTEEEALERVNDCLELLDITRLRQRAPYSLSGGEKRRVAFAAVLALNPDALVADEPLASLDEAGKELVVNLFKTLHAAGKTLVFATHSDELIAEVSAKRFKLESRRE
ncbi:MAG: energy-coupling factor ABC transporter ATP-binding protein [Thermoguttaceae bacterium]|jgi:cobalt/nickel transport system ATP-binding protein